jgi:hypothetical protein
VADEPDQLRDDIRVLRSIVDAALDRGYDRHTLSACVELLNERRDRLAQIEGASGPTRRTDELS